MTDPTRAERPAERPDHADKSRRLRFPRIDLVTLMLALLAAVILLFVTAELWMPHSGQLGR